MDFAALLSKDLASPWVPEIKGGKDTSHFDPIDDGEDIRPYGPGGRYYDNSGWDESF